MAKEPIDSGEMTFRLASRLDEVFMTLPPETRAALWLHLVEGEDLAEVAGTLELSPLAVERLIRGGLRELRQFAMDCGLFLSPSVQVGALLRQLPRPLPTPGFQSAIGGGVGEAP